MTELEKLACGGRLSCVAETSVIDGVLKGSEHSAPQNHLAVVRPRNLEGREDEVHSRTGDEQAGRQLLDGPLGSCQSTFNAARIGIQSNLSLECVATAKVERSAVPSRLGSLARDGGSTLCDDCAWQDCSSAGLCIRPFVSPVSLLGLDVTPLEAVQILDEIAAAPPKLVFLGVDLGSPDLRAVAPLATVSLTGAGERPVVVPAMPAVPLRSDDGASLSENSTSGSSPALERPAAEAGTAAAPVGGGTPSSSTASPVHAGTQC